MHFLKIKKKKQIKNFKQKTKNFFPRLGTNKVKGKQKKSEKQNVKKKNKRIF